MLFNRNIVLIISILCCFNISLWSQKSKPPNLPGYDKEKLHFGFSLSVNKAEFSIVPAPLSSIPDSIRSINVIPDWGFNLGIVSDLRLHDYLTVRFLPALSFQGRKVEYQFHPYNAIKPDSFYVETKKAESTLLDFPINLKLRSERLNNMSAYVLGGFRYSIDLASQASTVNPELLKLNASDMALDIGVGLDFYLEYFKLSTEIKFAAGIKDRLFHENTAYSAPIDKILSKVWIFSLNFEG